MPYDMSDKLKIAVTSRALFDLQEEDKLFREKGLTEFENYQIQNENTIIRKGASFDIIEALLNLNSIEETKNKVEVILFTRNNGNSVLRVFNSLKKYHLDITRGVFTGGADLAPYLKALDIDLFLTADKKDAQMAIDAGIPSAIMLTDNLPDYQNSNNKQIKIAFDGDAVIFSEESEIIFKRKGLSAFIENEYKKANIPMSEGPFVKFLKLIALLQNDLGPNQSIIRTALVTARSAPSHERVIRTLRKWNVRIDEMFFLGGLDKVPILRAFGAMIFFDDQTIYTNPAAKVLPAGKVPYKSDSELNSISKS